eukprot:TRINITY_DN353_c1_g1_i12.p1 TRINITY_DN353_c1_g1~~TRINITY_DN353_c1_g1_i12.p1  ORF type:complete len:417 (+),score=127.58 TRINITY_DN353_c1_g1_i12:67-1251(+)
MEKLQEIAAGADHKAKAAGYRQVLDQLIQSKNAAGLKEFANHMLDDKTPLVISRTLLQAFASSLPLLPAEEHMQIAHYALERIQPRVVAFEEQVSVIRLDLAKLYEAEEQWKEAARILIGIPLDSGQRVLDAAYKVNIYVHIAQLYLEDDEAVSAEAYINRAAEIIHQCGPAHEPAVEQLQLRYKVCFARIVDYKRQFIKAALRYYELSQLVAEHERLEALQYAVICAILAAAGPQRSRMLSTLYKDERSAQLDVFPILDKMYMERILRPAEVERFASVLKPHQMALRADGSTVLAAAVVEHNVLAASRLYNNVSFGELGALLDVPPERAEKVAARMIQEQRLSASIDQIRSLIQFDNATEALSQWDKRIASSCTMVNNILETISLKHPALAQS